MSQIDINSEIQLISVCIVTYNHENYIEETLSSIFNQSIINICSIIIHDDSSTDKTVEIIESFKIKYPNKIISIYQNENKFSCGVRVLPSIVLPYVNTQFIALCDGDDVWEDKDKLKKQLQVVIDTEADICFSSAYDINQSSIKTGKFHGVHINQCMTLNDVVKNGGGFMPTSSVFFKSKFVPEIINFFKAYNPPFSDFYIQTICSQNNKIAYINQPLVSYRTNHDFSWSVTNIKSVRMVFKNYLNVIKTFNYLIFLNNLSFISSLILFISISRFYLKQILKYSFTRLKSLW